MGNMKKTTIKDVAKEADVSISVVSYVLNNSTEKTISDATKERVMNAAKKLNYVPNRIASGMRMRKSLSIGVVSYWELEGTVYVQMLSGISKAAAESNYSVVLCNARIEKENYSYLDYFYDGTIDGILFISPYEQLGSIDEAAHITKMKNANAPFVIINGHSNEAGVNYINIDFYGSTYLATSYLIKRGYKEITYVAPLHLNYDELKQRYLGYGTALAHNNLKEKVCGVDDIADNIKNFKAVVTNKSDTAHAVMKEALNQNISIPNDFVMIAGNTEAYSEYLFPPLSTVKIPAKEMGILAAEKLLDSINGDSIKGVSGSSTTLECSLQIRESC